MKVAIRDLGRVGLVTPDDRAPTEVPRNAFTYIEQARFIDGSIEPFPGKQDLAGNPAISAKWCHPYSNGTTNYVVYAAINAVSVWDGSTVTDITGTAPTGTASDIWTGGVQFGVLGVNNGVDVPQYWAGNLASNLATFTGWNANWRCKAFRPFRDYWIALNITKSGTAYPHMVKWSAAADPGSPPASWDETDVTIDAGENNLDGQDVIVDGLAMGDRFIVYKERSMWAIDYIGAPLIFRFSRLPFAHGAMGRNCVGETPLGHVVLTKTDVVLHNGGSIKSIASERIKRAIFDNLDSTYAQRSFVFVNTPKQEVWVCPVETGGAGYPGEAYVWNWEQDTWSKCLIASNYLCLGSIVATIDPWDAAVDISWDAESLQTWDYLPLTTSADKTWIFNPAGDVLDVGYSLYGTTNTTRVRQIGLQFDDEQNRYLLRGVWPRVYAADGITLTVAVGASDTPIIEADLPSLTSQTFTVGTSQKCDFSIAGRYFVLQFTSATPNKWRLPSLVLDVEKMGQH